MSEEPTAQDVIDALEINLEDAAIIMQRVTNRSNELFKKLAAAEENRAIVKILLRISRRDAWQHLMTDEQRAICDDIRGDQQQFAKPSERSDGLTVYRNILSKDSDFLID